MEVVAIVKTEMMNFKRTIKRVTIAVIILLTIQTLTYLFFARGQLEKELFTYPNLSTHPVDSAFVRDFYVTSCWSLETWEYLSHNLQERENEVKEKLGVKFIAFQRKDDHGWYNPEEANYRIVYHTWARRPDYWTLFGLYKAVQTEEITVDRKYLYEREIHYRWILFFWMKYFELDTHQTLEKCR